MELLQETCLVHEFGHVVGGLWVLHDLVMIGRHLDLILF
jgi:hypothetical protein